MITHFPLANSLFDYACQPDLSERPGALASESEYARVATLHPSIHRSMHPAQSHLHSAPHRDICKIGRGKEESDLKGKRSAVSSPSCAIRRNICIEERMELSAIGRKEEREEGEREGTEEALES